MKKNFWISSLLFCILMNACGSGSSNRKNSDTGGAESVQSTEAGQATPSANDEGIYPVEKMSRKDSLRIVNTTLLQIPDIQYICGNGYIVTTDGIFNAKGRRLTYTSDKAEPVVEGYYPKFVPYADKFFDGRTLYHCMEDSVIKSTPVFDAEVEDKSCVNINPLQDGNMMVTMGEYGEKAAIYAENGDRLTDWLSHIQEIAEGKYLIESPNGFQMYNAKGELLSEHLIQNPGYGNQVEILKYLSPDGKVGYMSVGGQILTEAVYDNLRMGPSFFLAEKDNVKGYINEEGAFVGTDYEEIGTFAAGLAAAKKNGLWGFINEKMEEVIPFAYEAASIFSQGLAPVKKNGQWGYINVRNEEIIPFQFSRAQTFSKHGIAEVYKDGERCLMGPDGYIFKTVASDCSYYMRGFMDFMVFKQTYSDPDKNYEAIIMDGTGKSLHAHQFKFARINGGDTVTFSRARIGGWWFKINRKDIMNDLDDGDYIPGKPYILATKNGRNFYLGYDGSTGFDSPEDLESTIQANLSQTFDRNAIIDQLINHYENNKKIQKATAFKDTYKFIGDNKIYVEMCFDIVGGRSAFYDVEATVSPAGMLLSTKQTFDSYVDTWTDYGKPRAVTEFGVEEDVMAYLNNSTFVSPSGVKLNFINMCMYMNGQRVTGRLQIKMQPHNYTSVELQGTGAWLVVDGISNAVINRADGVVYKKE